jgi:hypothetical protein
VLKLYGKDPGRYPLPGGNEYRNLNLQVRGVAKMETIFYSLPLGYKHRNLAHQVGEV